jgi:hypothetical protein
LYAGLGMDHTTKRSNYQDKSMATGTKAAKKKDSERDAIRAELGRGFKRGLPTVPLDHMHDVLPAGALTKHAVDDAPLNVETGMGLLITAAKRHGIATETDDESTTLGCGTSCGSTVSGFSGAKETPQSKMTKAQVASLRNRAYTQAAKDVDNVSRKVAEEVSKAIVPLMRSQPEDKLFADTLTERLEFAAAFLGQTLPQVQPAAKLAEGEEAPEPPKLLEFDFVHQGARYASQASAAADGDLSY